MSNYTPPLRSGMTAIAAVIALSSTSVLAQATDSAAAQAAPAVVAPPAPDVAAPATPPVAQAAPVAPAPVAAAPAEAAPAMRTMSTPVEHDAATPADSATAAPHRAPAARAVSASKRAAPTKSIVPLDVPKAAPAEPAAKTPAIIPTTPAPAPIAAAPTPAPVAKTSAVQTTERSSLDDDAAPIAGAVGLGLLAIGGLVFAFRRKRRADEDVLSLEPSPAEASTVLKAAPLKAARQAAVPPAAAGPSTLPNGFDLSRFGRHTRAAYRGPTPDNPSLSLKHRLRRASFFDQREREAGIAPSEVRTAEPVAAPAAAAPIEREDDQLTVRLTPHRNSYAFGYVFQK